MKDQNKEIECNHCNGRGSTLALQRLEELVGLILLSGSDAKDGKCHPYFNEYLFSTAKKVCNAEMIELSTGLAGRAPRKILGHDSSDVWEARKKILNAAGINNEKWGWCKMCDGSGYEKVS